MELGRHDKTQNGAADAAEGDVTLLPPSQREEELTERLSARRFIPGRHPVRTDHPENDAKNRRVAHDLEWNGMFPGATRK